MSVSAGATLYVFLCIFFRERRRSGRGRRCRKRPPVSVLSPLCVYVLRPDGCDSRHLFCVCIVNILQSCQSSSSPNERGQTLVEVTSLPALDFPCKLYLCHTLIRLLYSSSPSFLSPHLTPTLGLVCPFYLTSLQSPGFAIYFFIFALCTALFLSADPLELGLHKPSQHCTCNH